LPPRSAKLRSEGRYALAAEADASVTAAGSARTISLRSLAVGAGAAGTLAVFGFASGGYYPTAWGWGALVALWLCAIYLVVGDATRPGPLALTMLAGLGGLAAWTWLALVWSDDFDQTVLEGQRAILYLAVAGALVLIARQTDVEPLLGGALIGIFLPAGYALATRLFPDRLGVFEPTGGYRLSEPFYWNALGLFAAMGAALALGFAARGRTLPVRALAAAAIPILLCTTYFTFSRGAWLSLAIGVVAGVIVDPRRLQLVAAGLGLVAVSGLAVWLASRQDALTRTDAPLSAATSEGHRLALYLLLLAALSALVAVAFALAEERVTLPRSVPLVFAGTLAAILLVSVVVVFARYGGPLTIADKAWDSFSATPPPNEADLRERLFSFQGSYRVDLWEVALDDYREHPVLGAGPGSYEHYWNEHRPFGHIVRDAHSLYIETLAELGPLGLALLVLVLGVPLVAAFLARAHAQVPTALAAYVAFLAHAGVDWDWELPAVTLAALVLGLAIVAAADRPSEVVVRPPVRWAAAGTALALVVVAFVGLVGASALSASEEARDKGRWEEAEDEAKKAERWWPWSPEPWRHLGEAQLGADESAAAAASFRRAVAKDPDDWELWYDLYVATEGAESARALAEVRRLNPFYRSTIAEGDSAVSR
jgi:O-Antigen ligase